MLEPHPLQPPWKKSTAGPCDGCELSLPCFWSARPPFLGMRGPPVVPELSCQWFLLGPYTEQSLQPVPPLVLEAPRSWPEL